MNTRSFPSALICLLFPVAGCAASAILDDDLAAIEPDDESDDTSDDPVDGIGPDDSLSVQRDAGRADAGKVVDAGRAPVVDAGKDNTAVVDAGKPTVVDAGKAAVIDSGTPAVVVDAGKPAVVDAGKAAVVDAGASTPVTIPIPAGCTAKTLQSHHYAFCTAALSFNDARSACIKAGLDLAIVGDRTENDFVASNGESWIGETYVSGKSAYLAVVPGNPQRLDGAAVSYTNWSQGNATDTKRCGLLLIGCHLALGSENCIRVASGGGWDDAACSSSKGYVCESY
jgi:hypothetical protein